MYRCDQPNVNYWWNYWVTQSARRAFPRPSGIITPLTRGPAPTLCVFSLVGGICAVTIYWLFALRMFGRWLDAMVRMFGDVRRRFKAAAARLRLSRWAESGRVWWMWRCRPRGRCALQWRPLSARYLAKFLFVYCLSTCTNADAKTDYRLFVACRIITNNN